MLIQLNRQTRQPLSLQVVLTVMAVVVVVLALLAGFYKNALDLERRRYLRLEDRYVRVRDTLGREKTQQLIDESHLE